MVTKFGVDGGDTLFVTKIIELSFIRTRWGWGFAVFFICNAKQLPRNGLNFPMFCLSLVRSTVFAPKGIIAYRR